MLGSANTGASIGPQILRIDGERISNASKRQWERQNSDHCMTHASMSLLRQLHAPPTLEIEGSVPDGI